MTRVCTAFRDDSSFGLNILGPLCLWQCFLATCCRGCLSWKALHLQLDSRDGEARETFEPEWPESLWSSTPGLLSALDCSCILSIKSEHSFNLTIQPGESALTEGEVARLLLNDVLSSVELRQLVQCDKHAAILPSCKVPHLHQRINPKPKYWASPPVQCHRAFQGVGLAPPRTNPPCRQRSQPRVKTGLGRKVVPRKN